VLCGNWSLVAPAFTVERTLEVRPVTGGFMNDAQENRQVRPLSEVRKEHVRNVLRSAGGDIERTSRILGIRESVLRRLIKQFGLAVEGPEGE
jgi:DNA-binding NtrC family response regulator